MSLKTLNLDKADLMKAQKQDLNQNLNENLSEFSNSRRKFFKTSALLSTLFLGLSSFNQALAKTTNLIKEKTMNLTKIAKENFIRLFGKNALENAPLAKSDGEFLQSYINCAFDESLAHTKALNENERLKLILGALIATQGLAEFKIMLKASLNAGVKPDEVKEILYQSTHYVGIGKALDFIIASNEIFNELNIALSPSSKGTVTRENRREKGLEIQRKFFGEAIDKGNATAADDEKHIRAFLSAHCFGDFYTRKGLDLSFRELLTFVLVSVLGGADVQVKAHVAGNLNIGNDRKKLLSTITALIPYICYPRSLNALSALNELAPANA